MKINFNDSNIEAQEKVPRYSLVFFSHDSWNFFKIRV